MHLTLTVHDRLRLYTRSFLAPHHEQVVSLLYQPIIGMKAVNLYLTLWRFLQIERKALYMTHSQLLTFFDYDLEEFENVRHRLEGIDLLHVYYHHQEGYYLYELRQPLTSQQFFQDSNLNVHLLYKVGFNLYEYLEKKFMVQDGRTGLTNITKPFNDVYPNMDFVPKIDDGDIRFVSSTNSQLKVPTGYSFDYELFLMLLNKSLVSKELIDETLKQQILNEAALYNFDAQMMSKVVLDSVDEKGQIDPEKLHETAREYYRRLRTRGDVSIKPAMTEKEFDETINIKEKDEKRKIILRHYKTKTPHEWLNVLIKGEVPNRFLDVVYMIQNEYHLPVEVMNVLLEYVLSRTGRLPLEYCRTVAASWSYKRIKTAEQAMAEVQKIVNAEENYKKEGKLPPTYARKRRGHVASEPDWLKDHEQYRKQSQAEEVDVDIKALEDLLSSFK